MADIAMCMREYCPNAYKCYRVQAKPNDKWQSYSAFNYHTLKGEVVCEYYWPMDKEKENDKRT